MKKASLLFLIVFCAYANSQTLPMPALWFKAAENFFVGKDTVNQTVPIDWNGSSSLLSADFINGYPALKIVSDSVGGHFTLSTDVLKNRQNALFLIVYQPFKENHITYNRNNLPDYGLWTLQKEDTTALTSIRYGSGKSRFRYQYEDYPGAIVTSNFLSFKNKNQNNDTVTAENLHDTILLCYADSLFFSGKLSEFIVINQPITENFRQVWQSYLALKYGAALYKGNYLNAQGDTLWHYSQNEEFSDGVGGIGRDEVLGLRQNFSTIAGDSIRISLHSANTQLQTTQTQFQNGEYIFWGHNGQPAELGSAIFHIGNDFYCLFNRIWKIRPYTQNSYLLDLEVNMPTNNFNNPKLFISNNQEFLSWQTTILTPTSINNGKIRFENLNFTDSTTYFTFGYTQSEVNNSVFNNDNANSQNNNQNPVYQVFTEAAYLPNPVVENLYIDYKLTRPATIWFSVHGNGAVPLCQTAPANKPAGDNQSIIPMGHLPAGTYTVDVHVDDMLLMQVIIKQ
jgi:hypothetical protein